MTARGLSGTMSSGAAPMKCKAPVMPVTQSEVFCPGSAMALRVGRSPHGRNEDIGPSAVIQSKRGPGEAHKQFFASPVHLTPGALQGLYVLTIPQIGRASCREKVWQY